MFGKIGLKQAGIGVAVIVGGALVINGYVDAPSKSAAAGTSSSSTHASSSSSAGDRARVDPEVALTRRASPTSVSRRLGMLSPGASVSVRCATSGQSVAGDSTWYRLSDGSYVSGRYVTVPASPRRC
jgi:hypothetical protein